MFGRRAAELCKEVANCTPEGLPPYNDELVSKVLQEVKLHDESLRACCTLLANREEEAENSPEASAVLTHHACMLRNKRLLLAYHAKRLDMIRQLRWEAHKLPEKVASNLSAAEQQFFKKYDILLKQYMGKRTGGKNGINLDLMLDLRPPGDPNKIVIVRESKGEVLLSVGPALLVQGSQLLLPREDAELLIRQGLAEDMGTDGHLDL